MNIIQRRQENKQIIRISSNNLHLQSLENIIMLEHSVKSRGSLSQSDGPIKLKDFTEGLDFILKSCLKRVL